MKIIYQNGFTPEDLATYRPTIYRNIIETAHALITAMQNLDIEPHTEATRISITTVLEHYHNTMAMDEEETAKFSIPIAVTHAVYTIWQDDNIQRSLEHHPCEFRSINSSKYFFMHIRRIGASDYMPTIDDVLNVRATSTGITETKFVMGPGSLCLHVVAIGALKGERRKWIHCFSESVQSILFCVSLTEYDQVCYTASFSRSPLCSPDFVLLSAMNNCLFAMKLIEGDHKTRMHESLALFDTVINSRWFACSRVAMILLLNKIDIFKKMIPCVPLQRYGSFFFPPYLHGPMPSHLQGSTLQVFSGIYGWPRPRTG